MGKDKATVKTRVCTKCSKRRVLAEFQLDPKGKHGRRSECRRCRSKMTKAYEAKRYSNPKFREEKKKAVLDRYYADHETERAKARARMRQVRAQGKAAG